MAITHLFTAKQETNICNHLMFLLLNCLLSTRIWPCVPSASLITPKTVITCCTERLPVLSWWVGEVPRFFLRHLAISSLPHIYQELSFFVRESNLNSVVDILSSKCDPLTYLGVGFQSRLQLLWLCAVSKRHIKANFSGNSLKIAVRSLRVKGEKRADIPLCTSSFKKQPLCARTWCCIII